MAGPVNADDSAVRPNEKIALWTKTIVKVMHASVQEKDRLPGAEAFCIYHLTMEGEELHPRRQSLRIRLVPRQRAAQDNYIDHERLDKLFREGGGGHEY